MSAESNHLFSPIARQTWNRPHLLNPTGIQNNVLLTRAYIVRKSMNTGLPKGISQAWWQNRIQKPR